MDLAMAFQMGFPGELFAAQGTGKGLLASVSSKRQQGHGSQKCQFFVHFRNGFLLIMEFNKTVSVTKPEMFFEVSSGEEVLVAEVAEVRLNPYIVSRRAQNHIKHISLPPLGDLI